MSVAEARSVAEQKRALREAAVLRRDRMSSEDRMQAARAVAATPFPVEWPKGAIISGFSPIKTEFNPLPLMRKLAAAGAQLALPKMMGRGKPLSMRAWSFGDPLIAGVWGIREPEPATPEVAPDILLVPFAVFDRAGYRIGYGAGYYDMTLANLRAKKNVVAIGVGYAVQETDKVPVEAHDQKLDFIITEEGVVFSAKKT